MIRLLIRVVLTSMPFAQAAFYLGRHTFSVVPVEMDGNVSFSSREATQRLSANISGNQSESVGPDRSGSKAQQARIDRIGGKTGDEDQTTTIATTTTTPLYVPNPNLGSVDSTDAENTMKYVTGTFNMEVEKLKAANADLAAMTCKELFDLRAEIADELSKLKQLSEQETFDAARKNSKKQQQIATQKKRMSKVTRSTDTADDINAAAEKRAKYAKVMLRHLQVLEQYTLKCGTLDKYCAEEDHRIQAKFSDLWAVRGRVDEVFTEAGWLRQQANDAYATEVQKASADSRWKEAWKEANSVWDSQRMLNFGLEVSTAACGMRPPAGPWTKKQEPCKLKPQDPVMQALLKDDPKEFVRRWRELIGRKAGIAPENVRVDVSGCFA